MPKSIVLGIFIVILALSSQGAARFPPLESLGWIEKVDPEVYALAKLGETEFIVFLSEQADLAGAHSLLTKLSKGKFVYERLTEVARREQGPVMEALKTQGTTYRSYWIANMIWVRGDLRAVQAMAERPDVARIYANPEVHFEEPLTEAHLDRSRNVTTIEWNIDKVNASSMGCRLYRTRGGGGGAGYRL
jgi:hypothetical protein